MGGWVIGKKYLLFSFNESVNCVFYFFGRKHRILLIHFFVKLFQINKLITRVSKYSTCHVKPYSDVCQSMCHVKIAWKHTKSNNTADNASIVRLVWIHEWQTNNKTHLILNGGQI